MISPQDHTMFDPPLLRSLHAASSTALSAARMQALIESSWDILSLIDRQGRLLYNSPAAQRIHGFEAHEFQGRSTFDFIHPEDIARVEETFARCLAQPEEPLQVRYRYARKGGSWVWMEAVGVNRLDDPAIQAVVVNARDITDRVAAEEERAETERQRGQGQKMDCFGSVAGGIAHDMNNVLGSILLLSSAHETFSPLGSLAQEAFATITKACHRGRALLRGLLDFARRDPVESKVLVLNDVVQEEVRRLEGTVPGGVRLVVALASDLRAVTGDRATLLQALHNVCVNAFDAMPRGGVLTLRTRNVAPSWVEVEVEDSGLGMTREVLDRALDPFFTTRSHGNGSGLGLSMAYATVRAHRGTLTLWSEPDRGARVTLRLPSCADPAPEAERRQSDTLPPATAAAAPRALRVLLVDDDALLRSAMGSVIRSLGYEVELAACGEDALTALGEAAAPDVVILDINMPGLGGVGTLPRIRDLYPTLPVLLATGRADQEAVDLARSQPGVTLMPKPFGLIELRTRLGALRPGA